jgi:hypothetical protein
MSTVDQYAFGEGEFRGNKKAYDLTAFGCIVHAVKPKIARPNTPLLLFDEPRHMQAQA